MPSSTRTRASSPSKSNSFSTAGPQKTNIVKRVAIEGKAERNDEGRTDGASIRIYLRVSSELRCPRFETELDASERSGLLDRAAGEL
jgi:hypothetical protein